MKRTREMEIIGFLSELRNSHSTMSNIFLYGSCINLFAILHTIYPDAKLLYNQIEGHVITMIGDNCYDITGKKDSSGYLPLSEIFPRNRINRVFTQMYNGEFQK